MPSKLAIIALVAFCALLGAAGQIFFKLSSGSLALSFSSIFTNWKLFLGLTLYGLATIGFLIALKYGDVSILYPIIATSYVWVTIFATVFLREAFPAYKWLGILFIILGVGVIVR